MKAFKLIPVLLLFILTSCGSSFSVYSDFDKSVDFSQYKTYDFHKRSINKVQISDLDKKRVLQAIEVELSKKGMTRSDNPDLFINISTKEKERVDVNQFGWGMGYGWGFGWNPYMWGGQPYTSTSTERTLFIDFIDAKKNELVWQGEGVAYSAQNRNNKEAIINEFVTKILAQYPPAKK